MAKDKDGISQNIYTMVSTMNFVGIGEIRRYVMQHHKRENFDREISIIRDIARMGYTETSAKYGFSRQRAEQILKKYYGYALNISRGRH